MKHWCKTHNREATHEQDGKHRCEPKLGGIMMPCETQPMTDQADYPPLRPCPFCGTTPKKIAWVTADVHSVQCQPDCGNWVVSGTLSKAEAADRWNRRAKL